MYVNMKRPFGTSYEITSFKTYPLSDPLLKRWNLSCTETEIELGKVSEEVPFRVDGRSRRFLRHPTLLVMYVHPHSHGVYFTIIK